ncbi:Protein of unknown function [Cotesia congregata]|uniref:Uncharacterized protein n=1 Tax=Cotesia congregata TaxID=51543 RepID=A0A8J2E7Y7_COTCN|nr:Protein of unknown function [Cotesia congregata]
MRKLLKEETTDRFNEKSKAYNLRRNYPDDIVDENNVELRLRLDQGKFENKISELGDNSCFSAARIYACLVNKYETYNNYIDYLEKYAEENKIVDLISIQ